VQVDAIQQRAREAPEVARALGGRAEAAVERGAAAAAGVGGGDELEAGGKIADAAGARDDHAPVLEGLAQQIVEPHMIFPAQVLEIPGN